MNHGSFFIQFDCPTNQLTLANFSLFLSPCPSSIIVPTLFLFSVNHLPSLFPLLGWSFRLGKCQPWSRTQGNLEHSHNSTGHSRDGRENWPLWHGNDHPWTVRRRVLWRAGRTWLRGRGTGGGGAPDHLPRSCPKGLWKIVLYCRPQTVRISTSKVGDGGNIDRSANDDQIPARPAFGIFSPALHVLRSDVVSALLSGRSLPVLVVHVITANEFLKKNYAKKYVWSLTGSIFKHLGCIFISCKNASSKAVLVFGSWYKRTCFMFLIKVKISWYTVCTRKDDKKDRN